MKKQMKLTIIITVIIAIAALLIVSVMNSTELKGYKTYGNDYCNTNHYLETAGDSFTDWECNLCGKSDTNSDTNVPVICNECANLTGRCVMCGKLEK